MKDGLNWNWQAAGMLNRLSQADVSGVAVTDEFRNGNAVSTVEYIGQIMKCPGIGRDNEILGV